jgi:puromycin-sensitive aminopeptidase
VTDTAAREDDAEREDEDPTRHRLPRDVVPVRYELVLEPDLDTATFAGTAAIEVVVHEPTDTIVLNAIELALHDGRLVDEAGTEAAVRHIELDADLERATLHLATPTRRGRWILHLGFEGVLNDKLRGFYRSTFTDATGTPQVIATTQFQATDARRAFPCWDEPDLKAVFSVTLVTQAGLLAVSNAREVARAARPDGRVAVRFADTMVMSTYLVAFVVGPLDATDPVDVDGVPLRVVYPRGKGDLTAYALEVGSFCLRYFADYYGIPFPGDKLDLVAVPDFAFGAMENLGCVTFREILVLVDPTTATQPELQNVTDVIAHELAHMWFGDLVTMRWWNGIWLNEAFATFMEMMATDAFRPEWDRFTSFGLSRTAAFDVDALTSTRPIEYPVVSPGDAEGMFDILTYEKGAAVVRMLEQYLGPEAFRDGIRLYLQRHAFANTETTDLWDALEEATGEPVRRIMDSWIFQGGHPVVTVDLALDEIEVAEPGRLCFAQHRARYAGDLGEGDPDADHQLGVERWVVPLIFTVSHGGVPTFEKVLVEADGLEIPLLEPLDWVLANTEGTGFYRVHYAPALRDALLAHTPQSLSPIERYGLVDDTWAQVLAGESSAGAFLALLRTFPDETDLSVWQRIVTGLRALDRLVEGDAREALRSVVRELVAPGFYRLGLTPAPDESDRVRALRGVLLEALGVLGAAAEGLRIARDLHDAETRTPRSVDPSLGAAAVSVLAATGDADDFEDFVARFHAAATPQEELRFLTALADFPDPALFDRTLAMSLTGEVRTQNAPYLLRRALTNRDNGHRAWHFVTREWDAIEQRFPANSIVRMLEGIRSLDHPDTAQDVFGFFLSHEVPQGDKTLAQHLERLEVNLALHAREAEAFARSLI